MIPVKTYFDYKILNIFVAPQIVLHSLADIHHKNLHIHHKLEYHQVIYGTSTFAVGSLDYPMVPM